jgi:Fe-S cluster assembly protein SufD
MKQKEIKPKTIVLLDPSGSQVIPISERSVDVVIVMLQSSDATVKLEIARKGSVGRILGIIIGSDKSTIRLKTDQHHMEGGSTSSLLIKSVLSDASTFFFEGRIRVEPGAQKTDAFQRNENLLLDLGSRAESKPILEIEANDVRCTHAATVQPIPKEQVWYLQTRGIEEREAKKLLINGFVQTVLDEIQDTEIRHRLEQTVDGKLHKAIGR